MGMEQDKDNYPNGFDSFVTTHHVLVLAIDKITQSKGGDKALVKYYADTQEDVEGIIEIAHFLTVVFEMFQEMQIEDGKELDFRRDVELFIDDKLYPEGRINKEMPSRYKYRKFSKGIYDNTNEIISPVKIVKVENKNDIQYALMYFTNNPSYGKSHFGMEGTPLLNFMNGYKKR